LREALRRIGRASIAALAIVLPDSGARAEPIGEGASREPVQITADTIEYDQARELYTAKGNVRITQPERTLTSDWASFSNATRQGVASGNVVIVEGRDTLTSEFLQFNVDSLQGVVFTGRLDSQSSRFKMQGAEIRKTGANTYVFEEGVFTTCRCPDAEDRDPWQIRTQHTDLEVEGYGTARNSSFDVLGVPVLWFPWMIYPLKRERQTGFLFPKFGQSSRSGFDLRLPFFWAVNDQINLVLTPEYLTKRGFKPSVDAAWVQGEQSSGALHTSFIHDQEVDPESGSTPFGQDRWAVEARVDQFLPQDWRAKLDLNLVSDNNYPFDFEDESNWRIYQYLQSTLSMTQHWGESAVFTGSVWLADDLQNPTNADRDRVVLQRLPDFDLQVRPTDVVRSGIVPALGAEYTYYTPYHFADKLYGDLRLADGKKFLDSGIDGLPNGYERNFAGRRVPGDLYLDDFPLGTEGDGIFQEGELSTDRGNRVWLTPRLGYPVRVADAFEMYPEVGYHTTLYSTDRAHYEERGLFTARLDLRTRLLRRFDAPVAGGSVLHLMEPRVGWAVVQSVSQEDDPIFMPASKLPQTRIRQFDLDNVTLDPADRIGRANTVTLGVGNRFYSRGSEEETSRLLADVSLSALYDIAHGQLGDFYLEGNAYPGGGFGGRYIFGVDMDSAQIDEGLLEAFWTSEQGSDLSITYRYLRDLPEFFQSFPYDGDRFGGATNFNSVNQLGFSTRVAFTKSWAVTYTTGYSFDRSIFLGNRGGIEYTSKCRCWAVRFEAREDRVGGVAFGFDYTLLGMGEDTTRPFKSGKRGLGGLLDGSRPL
jgi:lipopolysaccharide assembly outer membrane protein LptD (OstA)